jgi:hypothetical protein
MQWRTVGTQGIQAHHADKTGQSFNAIIRLAAAVINSK